MTTRTEDSPAIKPVRTVPLMAVIGLLFPVLVAIAAQGLVLWKGQGEQTIQMRYQAEKTTELVVELKSISAQLTAKSTLDADQSAGIRDLDRRVTRMETAR